MQLSFAVEMDRPTRGWRQDERAKKEMGGGHAASQPPTNREFIAYPPAQIVVGRAPTVSG